MDEFILIIYVSALFGGALIGVCNDLFEFIANSMLCCLRFNMVSP